METLAVLLGRLRTRIARHPIYNTRQGMFVRHNATQYTHNGVLEDLPKDLVACVQLGITVRARTPVSADSTRARPVPPDPQRGTLPSRLTTRAVYGFAAVIQSSCSESPSSFSYAT